MGRDGIRPPGSLSNEIALCKRESPALAGARSYRRCPGIKKAGAIPGSLNEGVGEHVRTRSQSAAARAPGETAERAFRNERRKTVSSAVPRFQVRKFDPAVDLMSRRHPLSSTRALGRNRLAQVCRLKALVTRRHQGHRHPLEDESYFFFLATLRVFFAVFFTALFAFFAFFAFLAMLPS